MKISGKTPLFNELNNYIAIDNINNENMKSLLQSQFIGEGIYGIEMIITNNVIKTFMIAPIIDQIDRKFKKRKAKLTLIHDNTTLKCFNIRSTYPSFLPLQPINFLSDLKDIYSSDITIHLQILFTKRLDKWKQLFYDQYISYLNGNDYPSRRLLLRSIQEKLITTFDNVTGKESVKQRVTDIEEKINSNGYRIEIRLAVKGLDDVKLFKRKLSGILSKMDYFNSLQITEYKKIDEFIQNYNQRKFSDISKHEIFSEKELIGILLNENNDYTQEEIKQDIKPIINETTNNTVQQSLISLMPSVEKKDRIIDESIKEKISTALKRVKIVKSQRVKVNKIEQGSTLQKITIKIPENINYSDIEKNLKNIKAALGVEALSIEQGDEPETISFLIPVEEREIVYLRNILENKDFIQYAKENILPFVIGVDILGNPIYDDLTRIKHLLIAGATGSGKSVFLNIIIVVLLILKKPKELIMYLIDPKKVEFSRYKDFPHVQEVITNMNKANSILKSLIVEMDKRYDFLAKKGYKDIYAYNKQNKKTIPSIVCVIDEFSELMMTSPRETEDMVIRLAQKARASGIHLIISTQRPEANVLTGLIKANLPSKISLRLDSSHDYKTVFSKTVPYQLLGNGDGVMRLEGQIKEFERFQAPVITLDNEEEVEIYEKIKQLYKGENVDGIEIIKELQPIDKLKKIIANTGETRVTKLREEMGIRINDVKDLMQELVEEGWLEAPKSKTKGYQLIASEEMMKEWRG